MGEATAIAPSGNMAPHEHVEESVKVPLTEGSVAVEIIDEQKDGKDDVVVYKGLSKDELMVYANDPKWKRIRIFLMVLFWLGWAAMLAVAILIVVKAPACDPPPSTTWLEKGALLQLDVPTPPEEAVGLLKKLGLNSLYIPGLISDLDFMNMKEAYVSEKVREMIQPIVATAEETYNIVTDFVPSPIRSFHVWTQDDKYKHLYFPGNLSLNYSNPELRVQLAEIFQHWKDEENVTGFLVPGAPASSSVWLRNLTLELNGQLNPDIALGESTVRVPALDGGYAPFKSLLMKNTTEWRFFKIRPAESVSQITKMQLVLLTLFSSSGTPVLEVPSSDVELFSTSFTSIVKEGSELRTQNAIRFGETSYLNTTDSAIVFSRALKGTPGYVVAVNLDEASNATFDLTKIPNVPDKGLLTNSLGAVAMDLESKVDMTKVELEPHSAMVVQFVAKE